MVRYDRKKKEDEFISEKLTIRTVKRLRGYPIIPACLYVIHAQARCIIAR
jgi:hypothetical protein